MNASTVAGSPVELYRSRRKAGCDHDRAVREAEHSYGRRDLGQRLEQARAEYEAPERGAPVEAPVLPDPSPLDGPEAEARAKVEGLRARRQGLALDALHDVGATGELADVEAQLTAANAEVERIGLARLEGTRREQEAQAAAEAKRRAAAQRRASALGAELVKAGAEVDAGAAAFGSAVAAFTGIAGELQQVQGSQPALAMGSRVEVALKFALGAAGVPSGTIDLPWTPGPLAPLAPPDIHTTKE